MKHPRDFIGSELWAGSESDFQSYLSTVARWEATTPEAAGIVLGGKDNPRVEGPKSRLLQIANGVGVISVEGKLVSEERWYNRYAGLVAYSEIIEAAHEALLSEAVQEALLVIASPGGQVAGIFDAVEALSALGKEKRLTGYTDSVANSGGLWLYSTAKDRFASPVASVGSIGVIQVHMEYTKAMEEEGVTPTVLRAGKYKALGNPYEKLSKLATDEMGAGLEHVYGVFAQSVADNLGTTYQAVDSKMGQGRVFIGSQAVEAGLVDDVSNFDNVYATVVSRVAKKGDAMRVKPGMSQGSLAAAAAAGVLSPAELEAAATAGTISVEGEGEGATKDPKVEGATKDPKVEGEGATKDPKVGGEGAAKDPKVEGEGALSVVQSQLTKAQDDLVASKVDLRITEDKLAVLQAVVDPLKAVVASSTNNMAIALGQTAVPDLEKVGAKELLERHETMARTFGDTFKVGGVGVSGTKDSGEPEGKTPPSGLQQARVRAAKVVHLAR